LTKLRITLKEGWRQKCRHPVLHNSLELAVVTAILLLWPSLFCPCQA